MHQSGVDSCEDCLCFDCDGAVHRERNEKITEGTHYLSLYAKKMNFYKDGQLTHYGMFMTDTKLDEVWDQMLGVSHYLERKKGGGGVQQQEPVQKARGYYSKATTDHLVRTI